MLSLRSRQWFALFMCLFITSPTIKVKAGLISVTPLPSVPFILNGQETVKNVVELDGSETMTEADFIVGNHQISATFLPPVLHYIKQHVGNVPAKQELHLARSCVVADPDAFAQAEDAYMQQIDQISGGAVDGPGRRLLFIDLLLGGAALVVASIALHDVQKLTTKVQKIDDQLQGLSGDVKELGKQTKDLFQNVSKWQGKIDEFSQTLTDSQAKQAQINNNTGKILDTLFANEAGISQLVANQSLGLAQLSASSDKRDREVRQLINSTRDDIVARFTDITDAEKREILRLYNITEQLAAHASSQFQYLLNADRIIGARQDLTDAAVQAVETKIALRRGLLAAFYEDVATLQLSGMEPFVQLPLLFPESDAVTPVNKRMVLDSFIINYVGNHTLGLSSYGELVSRTVTFFVRRDRMLDYSQARLSIPSIVLLFSRGFCKLPVRVNDAGIVVDDDAVYTNATECDVWVTVSTNRCQQKSSLVPFNWAAANASKSTDRQDAVLRSAYCQAAITQDPTIIIRTFADFRNYFDANICAAPLYNQANNNFQLAFTETARLFYLPQRLDGCFLTLHEFNNRDGGDLIDRVFINLRNVWPLLQNKAAISELVLHGRLPQGLEQQSVPFESAFQRYDADGNPIFDGSAAVYECVYGLWNAVSTDTVPVYKITPRSENFITKHVQIESILVNSTGFIDDYAPTDIDSDIIFNDADSGFITPDEFFMVGDIPIVSGNTPFPNVIYDVPDSLMDVSDDPSTRYGKVTCNLQPPDIAVTQTWDDWYQLNGFRTYKPVECAPTVDRFKYPVALDNDNFPYCLVDGATPVNASTSVVEKTPNSAARGKLCTRMKFFQVRTALVGGVPEVQFIPRKYHYTLKMQVPSGKFSNVLGKSNCTVPNLVPSGISNLTLELTNNDNQLVIQKYIVSTGDPHDAVCNFAKIVTVPKLYTLRQTLPRCNNVTVRVQRLSDLGSPGQNPIFSDCAAYHPADTQAAINSYAGIDLDVQIHTQFVVDTALAILNTVADNQNQNQIEAARALAAILNADADTIAQIDQYEADTKNRTFPPFIWTEQVNASSGSLTAIFQQMAQGAVNFSNSVLADQPRIQALLDDNAVLNDELVNLTAKAQSILDDAKVLQAATAVGVGIFSNFTDGIIPIKAINVGAGEWSLSDFGVGLDEIGKGGSSFIKAIGGGIGTAFGSMGGILGGFFRVFNFIMTIWLYASPAVVGYLWYEIVRLKKTAGAGAMLNLINAPGPARTGSLHVQAAKSQRRRLRGGEQEMTTTTNSPTGDEYVVVDDQDPDVEGVAGSMY